MVEAPQEGAPEAAVGRPLPPGERDPWPGFLRTMAWVGLNSFGGPVAQIGVMHREAVERRRWLGDGQFAHVLGFANVLPGPEALEVAIHLGWLRRGVAGGVAAGLLFVWPGFVSLAVLAWVYTRWGELRAIGGFLDGVRPVAVALIAWAGVRLAIRTLRGPVAFLLAGAALAANFLLGVPFLPLLLGCGLLGLRLARVPPGEAAARYQAPLAVALLAAALAAGWLARPLRDGAGPPPAGQAAPDSTAAPAGAAASDSSAAPAGQAAPDPSAAPAGAAAADSPAAPAGAARAPGARRGQGRLGEIAWVNTKAALVTFGGAYTVLPYLREQAVTRYRWVSDTEMVDALALGETTPGPLISVGVFLAYLAGDLPGALVGGLCLFLPSFVLVLLLGRHLERVERLPHARGFLWGVSAGTLGLILSLTAHVVPDSVRAPTDGLIALAALAALWRLRANALLAVLAGGLLGLARAYLGG